MEIHYRPCNKFARVTRQPRSSVFINSRERERENSSRLSHLRNNLSRMFRVRDGERTNERTGSKITPSQASLIIFLTYAEESERQSFLGRNGRLCALSNSLLENVSISMRFVRAFVWADTCVRRNDDPS